MDAPKYPEIDSMVESESTFYLSRPPEPKTYFTISKDGVLTFSEGVTPKDAADAIAAAYNRTYATPSQPVAVSAPSDSCYAHEGMHGSLFAKVWGQAGGGDAGRAALAEYAFNIGKRSALLPDAPIGTPEGMRNYAKGYAAGVKKVKADACDAARAAAPVSTQPQAAMPTKLSIYEVQRNAAEDAISANLASLGLIAAAPPSPQPVAESVRYACHCDLEPGIEPDGCVIDQNRRQDCVYARRYERKEQCEYWKPITITAPPSPQPVADSVPVLTVWYGAMPESNGKSNFTATLMRKGASLMDTNHYTFARSEYLERVRYEADSMRYLIGEIDNEPCCLDYDDKKHSGYVEPAAALQPVARQDERNFAVAERKLIDRHYQKWTALAHLAGFPSITDAMESLKPVAGLTDAEIERFATEIGMSRTGYTMDPQYFYRMFARAIERHVTGQAGATGESNG